MVEPSVLIQVQPTFVLRMYMGPRKKGIRQMQRHGIIDSCTVETPVSVNHSVCFKQQFTLLMKTI